jgi:hypothetical protein
VKFYFTKRSLQFSKFAHKSLGNPISPSSLSILLLPGVPFFPTGGASIWGDFLPASLPRRGYRRRRRRGRASPGRGRRRRAGVRALEEPRRGGSAWSRMGAARPRAWGTWWWPGARRGEWFGAARAKDARGSGVRRSGRRRWSGCGTGARARRDLRRGKARASVGPAAGGGGVAGSRGPWVALFRRQTGGAGSGRACSRSTRKGVEEQQRQVRQQLVCKQHGVQGLHPWFDHVECSAWGG